METFEETSGITNVSATMFPSLPRALFPLLSRGSRGVRNISFQVVPGMSCMHAELILRSAASGLYLPYLAISYNLHTLPLFDV